MSAWLNGSTVGVVIPTRNEAAALPAVLSAIPDWVAAVVVADYKSTDGTPEVARKFGATVVAEQRPGYGRACLSGLAALPAVDIVVFVDGDASDDLSQMRALVEPIACGETEFVLASRNAGLAERGSLTPQQLFGNWLACSLMRLFWGARFSDLGPFRAIRREALDRLAMRDENYGWTIEMQVKALKSGLRYREVPARYHRRIGTSKVSGTLSGSVKAGVKILTIIFREALSR